MIRRRLATLALFCWSQSAASPPRRVPPNAQPPRTHDFFHRRTAEADIYFVANLYDEPIEKTASFRVSGRQPELWDPVTGQRRPLPEYKEEHGHTTVPMCLTSRQSVFIVFAKGNRERKQGDRAVNFAAARPLFSLNGPWKVAFDPKWGGPKQVDFASLEDWTKRPEPGIKYYSGTAVYTQMFDAPKAAVDARGAIYLDLGTVKNVARVRLNGKDLGIVWCAPWRVNVAVALKPKDNQLEISVANLWINRILGDEQEPLDTEMVAGDGKTWKCGYLDGVWGAALKDLPDWLIKGQPRPTKRYTFINWQFYPKDAPLVESGLIGPVRLVEE